jgi:Protein of unknown function (DUF2510)
VAYRPVSEGTVVSTPAGWYPDPDDPSSQRYFDGSQWTEQRMPAGQPLPAPPSAAEPAAGNGLSIGAIICGVLALLICPILLGPAGIIFGVFALRRGESLAKVGIGVAVGGMIGGFILGAALASMN